MGGRIIVRLPPEKLAECREAALAWWEGWKEKNKLDENDTRGGKHKNSFEAYLEATVSEAGVAQHYRTASRIRDLGPDDGHDIRIGSWKANVKSVPWKPWNLKDPWLKLRPWLVKEDPKRKPDIYLLTITDVERGMVALVGWAPCAKLEKAPMHNVGHGPFHCLTESDLTPCKHPEKREEEEFPWEHVSF